MIRMLIVAMLLAHCAEPVEPQPSPPHCPTARTCADLCFGQDEPWECYDACLSDDDECLAAGKEI